MSGGIGGITSQLSACPRFAFNTRIRTFSSLWRHVGIYPIETLKVNLAHNGSLRASTLTYLPDPNDEQHRGAETDITTGMPASLGSGRDEGLLSRTHCKHACFAYVFHELFRSIVPCSLDRTCRRFPVRLHPHSLTFAP